MWTTEPKVKLGRGQRRNRRNTGRTRLFFVIRGGALYTFAGRFMMQMPLVEGDFSNLDAARAVAEFHP